MKTTYNLILAAFAAAVALSSCTKDIAAEKQDTESDGLRTIEISFETHTKTVLNEDDPEYPQAVFKSGDKIMVANGKEWEECTVTPSFLKSGMATFTTKLQGNLSVVYPSKSAVVKNGKLEEPIVPANQTGRFEDASIAVGKGKNTQITLIPYTAVLRFYVGPSIGVDSLVIESKANFLADGEFDPTTGKQLSEEPVKRIKIVPPVDEDVCYVAVRESKMSDDTLTVKSYTKTQKAENEEGLVIRRYSKVHLKQASLVDVFIPYYLEVQVGDTTQRWGYCNVGAFRPKEAGKYFAWGDTDGYKWDKKEYRFDGGHYFNWINCPFNTNSDKYNKDYFESNKDEFCPDGSLAPDCDAALANWGGSWRMPTKDEIDSLYAHIELTAIGEKGLTITTVDKQELFFPLTGYGYYEENNGCYVNWPESGMYWTSSLNNDEMSEAYCFNFTYNDPDRATAPSAFKYIGQAFERCSGLPIRPIFDYQAPQEISFEILPKYEFGGIL